MNNLPANINEENLTIEVTTRCNSACTHCFARAGRGRLVHMEAETALALLKEGYDLGYRNLHLTGGEPLLWPHFFELIEKALNTGYEKVFFNTNGTLLDAETARRLAACGDNNNEALSLSVSLQGPRQLHEGVRGEGSFDKALAGLEAALEAGLPVSVFTTAGQSLLDDLPRFAGWLHENFPGMQRLTLIQMIRVAGDAFDLSGELLTPADFLRLVQTASLLGLYGIPVAILENPLANAAAKRLGVPWIPRAPALHREGRVVVMADGSITLSHSTRESMGVYAPGALEKVLCSDPYRDLVGEDVSTCPGCRYREFCRPEGMVRPSEWYRDMVVDVPYCVRVMSEIDGLVKDLPQHLDSAR